VKKKTSGPRTSASPRIRLSRIRALLGLASDRDGAGPDLTTIPSMEDLLGHTRPQLIECARCASLTGIHRLTKALLAKRIQQELERLAILAGAPEAAYAPRKFDLGFTPAGGADQVDIPWGYGEDRVTAMAVDPERFYVYWEVTDEALEHARAGLGPGGRDAWLNLRVYDVTDRIFDGTNAHHYFDQAVSRTDRQWFFSIGRPSSTAVVEVGVKSGEGYFVRIARSGRTDFPRREPAPPGPVEWLTVLSASGEPGEPAGDNRQVPAVMSGGSGLAGQHEPVRVWDIRRTHGAWDGEWIIRDESFGTAWEEQGEWVRERTVEWEGPLVRTTWEAGPFSYPVEPARYVEERYEGTVTVRSVEGRSHIVHGPWRVVIRGLGPRAERRILGVWEVRRSWIAHTGLAVHGVGQVPGVPGVASTAGGSEQILGASGLHWRAASEVRLGGASEVYFLGASEVRHLGASETLYAGASEWRAMGASEVRYLGASEWIERGASEARFAGASERLYPGASERRAMGASERAWSGASENLRRYPADPSSGG
jgi:hypothetical protein